MSSSTPRCTRSAAVAAVVVAALLAGCTSTGDQVYSGDFGPTAPIALLNRTIGDGQYRIGYSLWLFAAVQGPPVDVTCTIVDSSGRVAFFSDLERTAPSGRWTKIDAAGDFDLPEVTLGLRCRPTAPTAMSLVVRDVRIDVETTGR